MASNCVNCGAPLAVQKVGRPALYCGVACRRAAEFELRRVLTRVERLEMEQELCRRDRSGIYHFPYGTPAERSQSLAEELGRAKGRLQELLNAANRESE